MAKFAALTPEQQKAFGVASVLSPKAHVFYQTLHSMRHLGRVSDLVVARLRELGVDELKLRAVLLFTGVPCLRSHLMSAESGLQSREPMILEIGVDGDDIVVGLSFELKSDFEVDFEKLQADVNSGSDSAASDEGLARLVSQLAEFSESVFVRYESSTRRFEVVSAVTGSNDGEKVSFALIDEPAPSPKPEKYVDLGDTDYAELLKPDVASGKTPVKKAGELMAQIVESSEAEPEVETVVSGAADSDEPEVLLISKPKLVPDEDERVVSGADMAIDSTVTRVKGRPDVASEEVISIKGSPQDQSDDTVTRVSGSPEAPLGDERRVVKGGPSEVNKDEVFRIGGSGEKAEPDAPKKGFLNRLATMFSDDDKKVVAGETAQPAKTVSEPVSPLDAAVPSVDVKANVKSAAGPDRLAIEASIRERLQSEFQRREQFLRDQMGVVQGKLADAEKRLEAEVERGRKLRAATKAPAKQTDEQTIRVAGKAAEKEVEQPSVLTRWLKKTFKLDEADPVESVPESATEPAPSSATAAADAGAESELESSTESTQEKILEVNRAIEIASEDTEKQLQELETKTESIDAAVERANQESASIKDLLQDHKSKEWIDSLMAELRTEKSKIVELSRRLNQSIKQKELEFKNKVMTLEEELNRRDEQMRQKSAALAHSKDQLTQMTLNMTKFKDTAKTAAADSHFKKKYTYAQNTINVLKSENVALRKQVEDSSGAKGKSGEGGGTSSAEMTSLKQKMDRSQRQIDEIKKQSSAVSEKLREAERRLVSSSAKLQEMKTKMDQAMRVAVQERKTTEKTKERVKELEAHELKLKRQVIELESRLRSVESRARASESRQQVREKREEAGAKAAEAKAAETQESAQGSPNAAATPAAAKPPVQTKAPAKKAS